MVGREGLSGVLLQKWMGGGKAAREAESRRRIRERERPFLGTGEKGKVGKKEPPPPPPLLSHHDSTRRDSKTGKKVSFFFLSSLTVSP